jgi:hypothetical protein
MPQIRPRFSLLTILLLMALVACAITIWQLWREVGPLRAEVRRIRDEVGVLSIDDPSKIHAIQVRTDNELTWKWRIWLPENRAIVVRSSDGDVPWEGFPDGGGSIWIRDPGEHVIEYRITRDPRDDEWYGTLSANSGSVGKNQHPWVMWKSSSKTSSGVGKSTRSFAADQRIELFRYRVSQPNDGRQPADPTAGFMIWLEPAK